MDTELLNLACRINDLNRRLGLLYWLLLLLLFLIGVLAGIALAAPDMPEGAATDNWGRGVQDTGVPAPPSAAPPLITEERLGALEQGVDMAMPQVSSCLRRSGKAGRGLSIPSPSPGRTIRMRVTAYCPCEQCCGEFADGFTASGLPVTANGGRFVAAPPDLPFGTMLKIPGYAADSPVPVLDRGGAITGGRLDVFFPTHAQAAAWGVQWLNVTIFDRG